MLISSATPEPIIAWQYTCQAAGSSFVLPDGCRDLIQHRAPKARPVWISVPLMDSAATIPHQVGESFMGFRLLPWAQLEEGAIRAALQSDVDADPERILSQLQAGLRIESRLQEALTALAHAPSVRSACRSLGVAERSLQRLVSTQTTRSPAYWRALARVRRAGRQWLHSPALAVADLAAEQGYADQAHLCREFRRWFGCTPTQLAAHPQGLALLAGAAYG